MGMVRPQCAAPAPGDVGAGTRRDRQWRRRAGRRVDQRPQILNILTNRNVLLLSLSYLCLNYSFYLLSNWVFVYLVQERKFSVLESGWLAMTPPLAAAAGAGVGGLITAALCRRFGNRWGYRLVPVIAMPVAGALLLLSVTAANPYWAVAGLALCFAAVELNEGAFWGAAMTVGRGETMPWAGQ